MPKYRKIAVEVQAIQWTGDNSLEIIEFMGPGDEWEFDESDVEVHVTTVDGNQGTITPGNWIVRGVAGEIYPCLNDIFEKTFEEVT